MVFLSGCQSIPEDAGSGNWANVTLRVTGVGPLDADWSISQRIRAIQRAKVDAYAQLESKIMVLRISSGLSILDLSAKDDLMRKKIAAFIRGARIVRTDNDEVGVKVIAQLFLGDNFKSTIGLARKKQQQISNPNNGGTASHR
jgi:hypothetical protein